MDLDTNKDNPYNDDDKLIMEVELDDSDENSDLQTTVNNYTDTQLTKLLDTKDNLDELQIDPLSLIRTGSTNITHSTTNNTNNDDNSNNKNTNKNHKNDSDTATTKSTNDETNDMGNLPTDTDSNTGLQNLTQRTPPQTKHNRNTDHTNRTNEPDNTTEHTPSQSDNITLSSSTYGLLANIPKHLHTTLQMLNNLKEKQIKTKTTIENLTTHETDGTLPNNLSKTTDCHIILDNLRQRWVNASREAANKQLHILKEQHKRKLTNTETKITHATQRIKDNISDDTRTNEILKRTDEISQRFSARWLSKHSTRHKKNKNIKRLGDKPHNRNNKPTQADTTQQPTPIGTPHMINNMHTPIQNKTRATRTPTYNQRPPIWQMSHRHTHQQHHLSLKDSTHQRF